MSLTRDFPCTIKSWHDGDTALIEVDIGFGLKLTDHVRIYGINCPELNTPDGPKAKARAEQLLPPNSEAVLQAQRNRDKYGRLLGDFPIKDKTLAQILLNEKLAVPMLFGAEAPQNEWL